MRLAISIWEERVSPVMDTAGRLLIADVVGSTVISRQVTDIPVIHAGARVRFICDQGIDLLICGAISRRFEQMLIAAGVKVSPWFRGNVDDIIAAHLNGDLHYQNFFLPGCGRRGRRARQGRRGCIGGHRGQQKQWED